MQVKEWDRHVSVWENGVDRRGFLIDASVGESRRMASTSFR